MAIFNELGLRERLISSLILLARTLFVTVVNSRRISSKLPYSKYSCNFFLNMLASHRRVTLWHSAEASLTKNSIVCYPGSDSTLMETCLGIQNRVQDRAGYRYQSTYARRVPRHLPDVLGGSNQEPRFGAG